MVEIKSGETAHLVMTAHGRGAIEIAVVELRPASPCRVRRATR